MDNNSKNNRLYFLYLLTTLAIFLPIVGYNVVFNSKASETEPPISLPQVSPTPVPQNITVLAPVQGEIVHLNKIYSIKWKSLTPSTYRIALRSDKGEEIFVANTKRPDNYSWRVTVPSEMLDRSDSYQIIIYNQIGNNLVSANSGSFKITRTNHVPVISVSSPQNLQYGQNFSIPFTITDADFDKINLYITNLPPTVHYIRSEQVGNEIRGQIVGKVSKAVTLIIKATDDFGGIAKEFVVLKQSVVPTTTPTRAPTPIRVP